jgi:Xaa-Pro aminopeptidase
LLDRLDPTPDWAIVADPRHLMYLANFPVEPFSWASPQFGLLLVSRDGHSTLVVDNLAARRLQTLWVDQLEVVPWYNHQDSPGDRRLAVIEHFVGTLPRELPESVAVETRAVPVELLRHLTENVSERSVCPLDDTLLAMREQKDPDELELIRRCIRAGEAGHARTWEVVRPGVSELEVYREVAGACIEAAGMPLVMYGDLCSGPRLWTDKGGRATDRRLERGDLMIFDFSVVLGGYRGDFTNTIAVGGSATPEQQRLFGLCQAAMRSGEQAIRPGAAASDVWEAVNAPFQAADPALRLPHHAGHGIGLAHPEPPILVPRSTHRLAPGNVITLEPGVYVAGTAGMRIENNYLVTHDGYEQLTHHRIALG